MVDLKAGTRFDERAERVLSYLQPEYRRGEKHLPRPFFVEFTGSPDSGKSTSIDRVYHSFEKMGFTVYKPLEGAEEIKLVSRSTPLFNIRTAMYAISKLIDLQPQKGYDLVLFDRCAFDGYFWMMYWLAKGQITQEEMKFWQDVFLSKRWIDTIDAAFFVTCDPVVAIQRNQEDEITEKIGNTTNPKNLQILVDRAAQAHRELSPRFPQLELVETSQMSKREMVQYFADRILAAMERKIASAEFGPLKAV
jgi:thymidylate kinase